MTACVDRIKDSVLPELFCHPGRIGEYATADDNAQALDQFSNLMEDGAVAKLADTIGEIVAKLADADPKKVAREPSWIERMLGRHVEQQVRYQVARQSLDELLDLAEGVAERVRHTLHSIDDMLARHAAEVEHLRTYIQAGREFLEENPSVGIEDEGEMTFDRPRERFARKLANLATLQSSHEMSVMQMRLTRAQAMDMLDRFSETSRVLVPVWRQHTLALITTKHMSPEMVSEATKAHHALMRSLSTSLEGIES